MCTVAKITPSLVQRAFSTNCPLRQRQVRLALDRHGRPAQTLRPYEEHGAELAEPLERVEFAGRIAVAVGPLVVARRVDQRLLEGAEVVLDLLEVLVAAGRTAALDVADVDREGRPRLVDLGDEPLEAGVVGRHVVGHVAQGDESERLSGSGAHC